METVLGNIRAGVVAVDAEWHDHHVELGGGALARHSRGARARPSGSRKFSSAGARTGTRDAAGVVGDRRDPGRAPGRGRASGPSLHVARRGRAAARPGLTRRCAARRRAVLRGRHAHPQGPAHGGVARGRAPHRARDQESADADPALRAAPAASATPRSCATTALFDECTRTIVQQVEELKTLVNEFSTFARMPAGEHTPEDLNALVEEALVLFREGHREIDFDVRRRPEPAVARARPRGHQARGHQHARQRGRGLRRTAACAKARAHRGAHRATSPRPRHRARSRSRTTARHDARR